MTLQVICRKSKLAETGVIVDLIFFGKIDKLGSVWQWTSRSKGISTCVKGGVVNIDFELN